MATDDKVVPIGGAGKAPPPDSSEDAREESEPRGGRGRKKKEPDWDHYQRLIDRFALIYSTDTVYDEGTGLIMKISAMAHAHGADYVRMWKAASVRGRRGDGGRWTVMPEDVVFDPTDKVDSDEKVNLFRGLKLDPIEGDVKPMLDLAAYLTSRASEHADECDEVLHWLLCWMAYPLQHQGAKLKSAVVMHGDEGAGKNLFFETHLEIYGEYGKSVGQDELEDKFNDWRSRTLFVMADEASSRQELVHNKNRLKSLITSSTVQINPKNMPRREEANHMNVVFQSNELTPLALDNTDRRYLVVFTPPAKDTQFYKDFAAWRRQGGAAKWYRYLLDYPLSSFDPNTAPPMTAAKGDLIDLNRKTPERFWLEWSADELPLRYGTCSVDQAYRAYNRYAMRTGDRYPVQKALFSRMVVRISDSMKKPMRVKTMKVELDGKERATRLLLVCAPILAPGVTEGQWATECVAGFETELRKYLHNPHSPGGEQEGSPT